MKVDFKEEALSVESSAGCQEMEFGIRSCDVGFIMQLLRNDMYKYPIDAICREIASNSRDANREVGEPDTPIGISIVKNPFLESEYAISFSDIGPGISPDRMQNVFLNYGASTKRDTDEQTGGFGLGAKTPFAYTNTFCIETIYDCKKYIYVAMVKSGNKGRMYLMLEEECYDESGTTISVPIKEEDIDRFEHAAYRATFFWDTRPTYSNFTSLREVNRYEKILSDDDFTIVAESRKNRSIEFVRNSKVAALLDGIPYEIDNPEVGLHSLNNALHGLHSSVSILVLCHVKVGEVTISPNRETLQYNGKTLEKIKSKLQTVSDVLKSEGLKIIQKTDTLMDRHVFVKFLKSSGVDMQNMRKHRPFDRFTESELAVAYLGYRFSKYMEDEKGESSPFDLSLNGVRTDIPFSSMLPGLTLGSIGIDSYRYKRRFRMTATEPGLDFFSQHLFMLDENRNTRRENSFYDEHKTDMLVLVPSDILTRYGKMSMEEKRNSRENYVRANRTLRNLPEYGLGNYKLYSSLKKTQVARNKKSPSFKVFPLRLYGNCVISVDVKEIKEGHLILSDILSDSRKVNISESFYVPMKDLRKVKEIQTDVTLALFRIYYFFKHKKLPRLLYIREKDSHYLSGAQSVYAAVNALSKAEKLQIANAVTLDYSIHHWIDIFDGITFLSQRYSTAISRINKARDMAADLRKSRFSPPHKFRKDMESVSDLTESIKIMEEARDKFMLLSRSYGKEEQEELEHIQKYVTFFEQGMIEKGEIV